ncbi:MAG: hypothetical protein ACT4QD_17090 [Acidobacteriota bacterium]
MTDDQLRTLVRDAIGRHLGPSAPVAQGPAKSQVPPWRAHASFGRFLVARGEDEGGPCLIEPGVRCNHCGYCQSYGH